MLPRQGSYAERVTITLPNGDEIPGEVVVYEDAKGWWTRLTPDVPAVVPASGIAQEVGDAHDFIHDIEARGIKTPTEMVGLYVAAWERDQDD